MVLSNVFCIQKVVGLHNDVMSRYAEICLFCGFWPQTGPETLKFAKSQALARGRGLGPKKFFLRQKHFFSIQDLLKSVLEPFLKMKFSEIFLKFFRKKLRLPGAPSGSRKTKMVRKKVVKGGLLGLLTHLNGPK